MVRFHLVGLIAVGLAIQFPSALASFDSDCRTHADSSIVGYYDCTHLAANAAEFSASGGEYDGRCLCGNLHWHDVYDSCLTTAAKNRKWANDIQNDRDKRCSKCLAYYSDSLQHAPGDPITGESV
ncbi:BZ3500_MvSof-1268-A1-R1_Chr12-3g04067 [Microbotryum saponariae]|uniref:BZ3500_MvSof-1268-A1-R1_Chr12-3g04067 protein n=1 Tax=Microbotryum saponariae TaxID=289078 RepID=A0A2X0KP61_9BASI|nr:BZ3500_MvSof-1268-A1-R1_Chr12-3g04067 [Microbotryum saponariae]SDA02631.1 BZ3501_MvSof-1269-A2-R1_Chr12-3g03722 [Microbotryum saponariae]